MSDAVALRASIDELTDGQALQALMIVVDHEHLTGVAESWGDAEPVLREALADPQMAMYVSPEAGSFGTGELARAALVHAATISSPLEDVISQAVDFVTGSAERFDPATLTVGGAVIALLQTELKIERNSRGKWGFLLHKQPMRESTLGHVITALISYFKGPGKG